MRYLKNQNGMSLVEVLVAIAVGSVVMLMMYKVFNVQSQLYRGEQKVTRMYANTRLAMQRLTRLIRSAGFNPAEVADGSATNGPVFGLQGSGSWEITSDTEITFTADADEDETVDNNRQERIYLKWDSTSQEIWQGVIDATDGSRTGWITLFSNVTNFGITYTYDNGDVSSGTTDLPVPSSVNPDHTFSKVRAVVLTITSKLDGTHDLMKTVALTETVSSTIKLRNNVEL